MGSHFSLVMWGSSKLAVVEMMMRLQKPFRFGGNERSISGTSESHGGG